MAKKQTPPRAQSKPSTKDQKPHAGVDRRKKDMRGRKYAGTVLSKY